MRMLLKAGVSLQDFQPQMALAALVIFSVYDSHGIPFMVTSANDSTHMTGSLHGKGRAFDCRLPSRYVQTPGDVLDHRIQGEIKEALGQEFDVLLESDHIHVEYDPPEEGVA